MVAIKSLGIVIMKNFMPKDYVKIAILPSIIKYFSFILLFSCILKPKKRSHQKMVIKSSEKNHSDTNIISSRVIKIEHSEINIKQEVIE